MPHLAQLLGLGCNCCQALSASRPCPHAACWAPCEKTCPLLALNIPLPLLSSSCALWHGVVSSGAHSARAAHCPELCSMQEPRG